MTMYYLRTLFYLNLNFIYLIQHKTLKKRNYTYNRYNACNKKIT